jgi:hypothetical protein
MILLFERRQLIAMILLSLSLFQSIGNQKRKISKKQKNLGAG